MSEDKDGAQIEINLDRIAAVAHLGIRRASIFMGLGVNSSKREDFKSYKLEDNFNFDVVGRDLNDEEIQKAKEHFRIWIISNSLREVIESLSIALDGLYLASKLIAERMNGIQMKKEAAKIQRVTSVSYKLEEIKKIGIDIGLIEHFKSLSQVRNCLAHRRGVVGSEDCEDGKTLRIKWRSFKVKLVGEGWEGSVEDYINVSLPTAASVVVAHEDTVREFKVGQVIQLSERDLNEILYMAHGTVGSVCKAIHQFAKAREVARADTSEHSG
jgi:hypothetical protein